MAGGSETIVKILVKDEIYPSRFGMFLALGNIQHAISVSRKKLLWEQAGNYAGPPH